MGKLAPNNHNNSEKKWFLRKAITAGLVTVALAGCEKPQITEGKVYAKTHSVSKSISYSIDSETGRMKTGKGNEEGALKSTSQKWKVHIAQCLAGGLPPQHRIEKECKTNSFDVPVEVYNNLRLGQHADFNQPK